MPVNKSDRIFGTPVEPLFNYEKVGTNPDILQDWLVNMAVTNSLDIKASSNHMNIFTHGGWAECVFLMCDRFELLGQAKYAALEIFDRFMLKHIQDLYEHVQTSKSINKKADWEAILERVKNQAFLRILSCCQIASKLNSHYKVITVNRARRCLLDAGYTYSSESILQSEMRVLKTLSYMVSHVSCLDFIEILLEILGHNATGEGFDVKVYHDTAEKILTIVCLHRHEIYDLLYLTTAGLGAGALISSQDQKIKLTAVKTDKLLLSVAIVAAAVHINEASLSRQVIAHLNAITEVPVEDIQDFVSIILRYLQERINAIITTGSQS